MSSASGLANATVKPILMESSDAKAPESLVQQPQQQQEQQQQQQQQQPPPPPPAAATENQAPGTSNGLSSQPIRTASLLPQGQSRCVWSF